MKSFRLTLIFCLCLMSATASARVFNFGKQGVASYLRGAVGVNNLRDKAYEPGFPTTVSFPDSTGVNEDLAGEIGLAYTSSGQFTTRFGVEVLYPLSPTGLAGKNSSGTPLLSLSSQVYSIIPQVCLEYLFKKGPSSRFYFGGGAGYAITTIKNTVSMTNAGQAMLSVSDYIEEGTGYSIMGKAYVGFEFSFFDDVGFGIDIGYRLLNVTQYTANRGATTPLGTIATGGTLKNNDGTNRSTDLGGYFAAGTFRIYF